MQKVSFDAPIQSGFSEAQPGQASAWDDHDDKVSAVAFMEARKQGSCKE